MRKALVSRLRSLATGARIIESERSNTEEHDGAEGEGFETPGQDACCIKMGLPLFIIGSMRSGTTLLRLILDSHEDIAIGWETGFARAIKYTKDIPEFIYGERWYERYGLSEEDMNRRLRCFYASIFEDYARSQGARRWGEKTPLSVYHVDELSQIFPDAQFVCVVRHPAAVVASLGRWNYDLEDAAKYWSNVYSRVHEFSKRASPWRVKVLTFEELVSFPKQTLENLMYFLGEKWSDSLLNHHEVQSARGLEIVEGGTRADTALDESKVGGWLDVIGRSEKDLIRHECGHLMNVFGYRIESPYPLRRLSTGDEWELY